MGKKYWGIGALGAVLVSVMAGASAPAVEAAPAAEAAPVKWAPTYNIDPAKAYDLVAATPTDADPAPVTNRWASCDLPITIDYAAGSGVDPATIRQELAYPIRYLQALGYFIGLGEEVPYTTNTPQPKVQGTILVVATNNPDDQPRFVPRKTIGFAALNASKATTAVVGTYGTGLSSDVLLHEFGHVLGLAHKDGTVMTATDDGDIGFDAAETAAIDCR